MKKSRYLYFFILSSCLGITRFQVAYNVTYESDTTQYPLADLDDMNTESQLIKIDIVDGMRLDIQVRATDILGSFADDFIKVKVDMSAPVIEDLWLTRGDRLNISVHNVEDLAKLQ